MSARVIAPEVLEVLLAKREYCLLHGDCLERLRQIPDESIDSVVDDPPSSIGFMGLDWDTDKGSPMRWLRWMARVNRETLRVLKPGGFIVVWSLPRTSDLTGMALRLAGFEIIDSIDHAFGQGFPKSLDASKAIDAHFFKIWCKAHGWPSELLARARKQWKQTQNPKRRARLVRRLTRILYYKANLARQVIGTYEVTGNAATPIELKGGTYGVGVENVEGEILYRTRGATPEAQQFDGYQTALKPAKETWWIARKPFKGTLAKNLLQHQTGAFNVDACRVSTDWNEPDRPDSWKRSGHTQNTDEQKIAAPPSIGVHCHALGRWPANLVLTHHHACEPLGYRETTSPVINRFCDGARPFGEAAGEAYESSGGVAANQVVYACVPGCPVRLMDEQSGESVTQARPLNRHQNDCEQKVAGLGFAGVVSQFITHNDSGGASRFFNQFEWHAELDDPFIYLAKPSTAEREAGCEALPKRSAGELTGGREDDSAAQDCPRTGAGRGSSGRHNHHPTLKSVRLMMHLIRLTTRPGKVTLTRFAGSGTDIVAARLLGMRSIAIEQERTYCAIAEARVDYWTARGMPPTKKLLPIANADPSPPVIDRQVSIFEIPEVRAWAG